MGSATSSPSKARTRRAGVRNGRAAPRERRTSAARIPELGALAQPLIALSNAHRSTPLLYLELTGIDQLPLRMRRAVLRESKRAVAAAMRECVGSVLRKRDLVAAGPGARWFVALLAGRAVAAPARASVSDADLGLIAGRLQAAVRAQLARGDVRTRNPDSGAPLGVIAGWTVLDPVSTKHPLDELRQAARGAAVVARVEAQRAVVLAAVTHELRTPLTSILGYAEQLGAGLDEGRQAEYSAIIVDEGRRLQRLVESLIDIGAWTAGRLKLARRQVALADVVRSAWTVVAARAAAKNVRLDLRGDADAEVDPDRIEQVLVNLLDNALRHSPVRGLISVQVEGGTRCAVTVGDEGPGFRPDAAPKRDVLGFAVRSDGRSGLGLAISRLLVEAHGGEIILARTNGRGARFRIRLPRLGRKGGLVEH